jgi:hypothetical protein
MNDNSNPQQPPDDQLVQLDADTTVEIWSAALTKLVHDVQRLQAQNVVQQGLIDNMNARLQRLEGVRPPQIGNA